MKAMKGGRTYDSDNRIQTVSEARTYGNKINIYVSCVHMFRPVINIDGQAKSETKLLPNNRKIDELS